VQKLLDAIESGVRAVSAVVMFVSVVVIFVQVISRYIFNYTPPWSEELARTGNVWMTFLGIGMVSRVREHIRIDFVDYLFKEKGRYVFLLLEGLPGHPDRFRPAARLHGRPPREDEQKALWQGGLRPCPPSSC
jgi:TRAP-type C4-dicarboxylate transport system permease small subunit